MFRSGSAELNPGGTGRTAVALLVLGLMAVLVWRTMEPGKYQRLTWLLLGFFALRVLLGAFRSRRIGSGPERASDDRPVG